MQVGGNREGKLCWAGRRADISRRLEDVVVVVVVGSVVKQVDLRSLRKIEAFSPMLGREGGGCTH